MPAALSAESGGKKNHCLAALISGDQALAYFLLSLRLNKYPSHHDTVQIFATRRPVLPTDDHGTKKNLLNHSFVINNIKFLLSIN